jgi:beta-lactamase superfamily II metal-dependent hydrolase
MFRTLIRKAGKLFLAAALTFGLSYGLTSTQPIQKANAASPVAWQPGQLHIGTIDVGQGDSTLIVSPDGKSLLIDVNESSAPKIASYLQSVLGTKTVDYILLTHYHADHMGDYVNLLKNNGVTVRTATYDRGGSRTEYNSTLYQTYYDYVTNTANNAHRTSIKEGDTINMGPSMSINVVSAGNPATGTASGIKVTDENDNSIALKVKYNQLDYFVAGDLSGMTESYYTDIETTVAPKVGPVEVYRVDHHGSSHSSNQYFVDTLKPQQSIISCGLNSYGHPDPTIVSRLAAYGKVFQTEDGSGNVKDGNVILLSSDGIHYTLNGTSYLTKESGGGGGGGTTSGLKINEVLPAPSVKYTQEFVELYNPTSAAINLSGYQIDDIQNGGSAPYTIPSGTSIPAGGYYVYKTANVFNNTGDDVTLISPSGTVVDKFTYGSTGYDVSWYRVKATGNWSTSATTNVTMGTVNP